VGTYQLVMIALIFGAMWFLVIRPQQQRTKQHQKTVASLVPGETIVTIGGLVAEIVEVRGDRLLLKVADGTEMEYMKEAVGRILPREEAAAFDDVATEDAEDDMLDESVDPAVSADEGEDAE
jgi:preprotein translocase subunit YajC